ncbi:MAG: hypothetical protein LBF67_08285 [Prevotellaceae bacterium]|nr:hypothetical protein [Prevotellaceae bacterium]
MQQGAKKSLCLCQTGDKNFALSSGNIRYPSTVGSTFGRHCNGAANSNRSSASLRLLPAAPLLLVVTKCNNI